MTGKEKGNHRWGLGVRSQSGGLLRGCCRHTEGPGAQPLLPHSCCSCSPRGLPAFAVTDGSVPAWWAALPASSCPQDLSTAVPPVPVSH